MHESLRIRVARAGLAVDEAEQPLAGRAEEVIPAVERGVVQRGHVGGPLEHRGQRLAGVGGQVDDRLARVEALDEQQVHPRLGELAGLGRARDVDAQHAVLGIGVVNHVEGPVTGGHDRRVVDDVRPGDLDERAVPWAGHRTGSELGQREPGRPGRRDPGRAEVRRAGEVHGRRPERVGLRRRRAERHGLHRGRVADRDVGELGRVVHAQVVRQPGVGGIQQDVPHGLAVRGARVQRQPHRLLAQVDLERAFLGQVIAGQQARQLAQPPGPSRRGRGRRGVRPAGPHGGEHRRDGDEHGRGGGQPPSAFQDLHLLSFSSGGAGTPRAATCRRCLAYPWLVCAAGRVLTGRRRAEGLRKNDVVLQCGRRTLRAG